MSAFGTPIVNPVGGPNPIERTARDAERRRALKVDGRRRDGDEVEINSVQATDPIRNLKSNDQEEAADDRQGHPGYDPKKQPKPNDERPSIDIQA